MKYINDSYTVESVLRGHPDKICDQISDGLLDLYLEADKSAHTAIECLGTSDTLIVAGEVRSSANIKITQSCQLLYRQITGLMPIKVIDLISQQSPQLATVIGQGGAGDQGIMFGYACDETENYMPYAINMAHKLSKRLTEARKQNEIDYLRPDGKTQVTVEYENNLPKRIETILISTQHLDNVSNEQIKRDITDKVIKKVVPMNMMDENTKIYINPTGRFVIGGPLGDTGLTGRKIIVDTYGGYSRHGGGAFSGKDASKVDRSAAYMLRHIAKNIVANGYAKKCEIQISYAIGKKEPLSIYINTFGTGTKTEEELVKLIKNKFDLTPNGIINYLDLRNPIYSLTTNYGHFGKENLPWERIIKL